MDTSVPGADGSLSFLTVRDEGIQGRWTVGMFGSPGVELLFLSFTALQGRLCSSSNTQRNKGALTSDVTRLHYRKDAQVYECKWHTLV